MKQPVVSNLSDGVEAALVEILTLVRRDANHDFSAYKRATLIRRSIRRMHKLRVESVAQYVEGLRNEPNESRALFHELLLGVTGFFRDPDVFAYLAAQVLPGVAEAHEATVPRIWVAGCSTGEEAYTIAMLCDELGDRWPALKRVQLFASDVDPLALDAARRGAAPSRRLVPPMSPQNAWIASSTPQDVSYRSSDGCATGLSSRGTICSSTFHIRVST